MLAKKEEKRKTSIVRREKEEPMFSECEESRLKFEISKVNPRKCISADVAFLKESPMQHSLHDTTQGNHFEGFVTRGCPRSSNNLGAESRSVIERVMVRLHEGVRAEPGKGR